MPSNQESGATRDLAEDWVLLGCPLPQSLYQDAQDCE